MWKKFLRAFRRERDEVIEFANDIIDDVTPLLKEILKAGGRDFMQLVFAAVKNAHNSGLSNSEKNTMARKEILRGFRGEVADLKERTIQGAINLALAKLKQELL